MKKIVAAVSSALILVACSQPPGQPSTVLPPTPLPSPPPIADTSAHLWVLVIDRGGACVDDATVDVIGGQAVGRTAAQVTPCDWWDIGGGVYFADLAAKVPITLRASAPGYGAQEKTFTPTAGLSISAVAIELSPVN